MSKYSQFIKANQEFDLNKILQKFLNNQFQQLVHRNMEIEQIMNLLETYNESGFQFSEIVCNKMIDFVNKNMRNDGLVESILDFMDKIDLKPNLITYNTVMDFYCMNGKFAKAFLIF